MLTLKEWMELVDYRITEGSDYYDNDRTLYSLSSWNGDHDGWSFNIVFDPSDDQLVHAVEVCDYKNSRAYRMRLPNFGSEKEQAWDNVDFVDLESDDDFIQKSLAIKAGEDYDVRVSIPLNLSKEVLFELMKQAHEQDITFNELVEKALQLKLDSLGLDDSEDDGWDELCEDHWDDDGDNIHYTNTDDPVDFPAPKSKKKKKGKM